MSPDEAQTIALQALGWLVSDDRLLGGFLGTTGGSAEDLRRGAGDPAFLASVLDYVTADDRWVIAFCDATGLRYDAPLRARQALPGAGEMHWT